MAPEKLIVPNCDQIKAVIDEYGGWFDHEVTEQGYPTSTSGNGVPEDIQAYYHVRTQLLCNGIDYLRSLYIYDFHDGGLNAADNESRFGIIRFDGTAKPCYRALAIMTRALANTNYAGILAGSAATICDDGGQFL